MSSMMTSRRLSAYEQMMVQTPLSHREMAEDAFCSGCPYHRPNWEYRYCAFTECLQMKGMKTFWEGGYPDGRK